MNIKNSIYSVGKGVVLTFLLCSFGCSHSGSEDRPSPLRMDSTIISGVSVKIKYSSPAVRGREIWGILDPYGKVWRIGANRATVLEVSDTIEMASNKIPKGKYSMFAIPDSARWTIILNKEWDQWGAYDYDPTKDLFRTTILPYKLDSLHERLTFSFDQKQLKFRWEYLGFNLPLTVSSTGH